MKTVKTDFGTDILAAIVQNDLEKLKVTLDKRLKAKKFKIRDVLESEVYHKTSKSYACPLMLAVRLQDPTILK